MGEVSNPSRIAKLCRQSAEALRKALSAVSPKKVLRKGPKWTSRTPYLGVEKGPEAQKLPVNPTQEYYHPSKYGPQLASLAQVMRSMSGVRLRLRSRGGQVGCHPESRAKSWAK